MIEPHTIEDRSRERCNVTPLPRNLEVLPRGGDTAIAPRPPARDYPCLGVALSASLFEGDERAQQGYVAEFCRTALAADGADWLLAATLG